MTSTEDKIDMIKKAIVAVPDFPKPGILFRDVFPLMRDPNMFSLCIDLLVDHIKTTHASEMPEVIVGLDSRGFIFGPLIAQKLSISFQPVRKAGKLPGECYKHDYQLEYGSDSFEMQTDAIKAGQKVLIVDDLLATGGTMSAACSLMKSAKAKVLEAMVVIELADLEGRKKIDCPVFSLISY